MRYWPNPAHKKETTAEGPPRWNPDKSRCPDDMTVAERQQLLEGSVPENPDAAGSRRFALRRTQSGLEWFAARLTRFDDGVPVFHGYPEPAVPARVLRVFLERGDIKPAEYKRLLKVRN